MYMKLDPLHGKVKPVFFRYFGTAAGSALVASVFALIDAMMVGRYHGPSGTAALAVFNPCWTIIFSLGILAGIGASTFFASYRGRGDEETAQEYFSAAVIFGIVLSAVSFALLNLCTEPIFRFFGADDTLLALAKRYFASIRFVIPLCVFDNILSSFIRNDGDPGLAMKGVVIGGVFNAIGDYLFVFTLDMGIFGAGLATAIGLGITSLVMIGHFFSKGNTLRLTKPRKLSKKLANIIGIGFAAAITDLAMGIIGVLFNRQIMRYFGTDELAIYGVITQVTVFVQCSAYGIGQAAQPILSQSYGAKRYERIGECLRYALITAAVMGAFCLAVTEAFPNLFVRAFMTPTESVLQAAPWVIRVYSLSYALLPFNIFAPYYYQSLLKPGMSLVSSLLRSILVSSAAILLLPLAAGGSALWFSMLITEAVVAVYNAAMILKLKSGF